MTTNVFSQEKAIIAGENRFETSIEISKSWETSKNVILVNSSATSDMLCATVLSSQIDCPILLTNKEEINQDTIYELKRLKTSKVYIIGGEDVINENVAKSIEAENINIERIYGKDRYETSINIANKINQLKSIDTTILLNENNSVAHAVSMSPVAGNKNIPVIICNDDNLDIQKEWIENNNIKKSYIIDGQDKISEKLEKYLKDEKIKVERIYGEDRYETNMKVIENFYKDTKIDKVFYCKGEDSNAEIIDAMLVSPLASKNNSPIILLGENLTNKQKSVIKKKNIKTLVQVGYGVSEEAKKELYKIKESYTPPSIYYPQISKPQINTPQIENIKPPKNPEDDSKPKPPTNPEDDNNTKPPNDNKENNIVELSIESSKISEDKKTITITFNKDIYAENNLKEKIEIIIDPKNVVNSIEGEEKYIKLNKYDSVKINKNELIIKLENKLIGENSSLVIDENSIKDKEIDSEYIDRLRINNIKGENKKILFIGEKEKDEFINHLNNTNADIIKLETNIEIEGNSSISINKEIIIDGSNGEQNFKIINTGNSLSVIYIPTIQTANYNIELKNLDLDRIYIYIVNNKAIKLENMKINLDGNNTVPCVYVQYSTVEVKDLILISDLVAIEVRDNIGVNKISKLIIDGYVYNIKADKPSIKSKNEIKITDMDGSQIYRTNEIILKDSEQIIGNIYKIIPIEDNTANCKIYGYYYK